MLLSLNKDECKKSDEIKILFPPDAYYAFSSMTGDEIAVSLGEFIGIYN